MIGVRPANGCGGGWVVEQGGQQAGPYVSIEMASRVALAQIRALVSGGVIRAGEKAAPPERPCRHHQ